MNPPSPITPIPALQADPLFGAGADESRAVAPMGNGGGGPPSRLASRDRPAAALLALGAAVVGADAMVRPLLDASVLSHPVVHGTVVGAMLATALGVRIGWRPARRVARLIGYGLAFGAYMAYQRLADGGAAADLWVAAVLAAEAGALGLMMNQLGWIGDEE